MTEPYFSDKTPGPGTYNVDPGTRAISRRPPAYTMATRLDSNADYGAPGPATYTPRPEPRGPAFTMPGRIGRKRRGQEGPGPGEYDSDVTSSTRRPPAYTMKGKYRCAKGPEIPGPGMYTYRAQAKSNPPSYTMQGKYRGAFGETNPGPGNYNASCSSRAPKITIGERHPEPRPDGNPGPGAYNAKCPSGAPKYTFGGSHRRLG